MWQTSLLIAQKSWHLMVLDMTAGGDLPTPAQIRTLNQVTQAASQARRMLEASRALITANMAFAFCVLGTVLVVMHSSSVASAGPFVVGGLLSGYLIALCVSIQWMKRQRANSLVTVIDKREAQARIALASPRRAAAVIVSVCVFQMICALVWMIAFRHMSNSAILASLALTPVFGISLFVRRFVLFQFWEDLLFAGCIALAYAPMFLRTWDLTPLSFLALVLVIAGGCSLNHRWVTWKQSLVSMGSEDTFEEVRP